jgi:hypothetical protein
MTTDTNKVMISKSFAIIQRASALDALRGYAIQTMMLPERLYLDTGYDDHPFFYANQMVLENLTKF